MDLDLTKPVYLFILDLYRSRHMYPYYKEVIRKCTSTTEDTKETEVDGPVIAIRGSTKPFGSWSNEGIRARKISLGYYGLIINDFIPANSEYKWLDLTGKVTHGDLDIDTGYVYEPQPFINRLVTPEVPKPEEEIVIVVDSWAGYTSKITRQSLGDWFSAETFGKQEEVEKKSVISERINPNFTPTKYWEASNLDSLAEDLNSAEVLTTLENPIQIQNNYATTCSSKNQIIDGLEDIVEESLDDFISTETENFSTLSNEETIHHDENENRAVITVSDIEETHIGTTTTSTVITKEAGEMPEIEQETSFIITPVVACQTCPPSSDLTHTEMMDHESRNIDKNQTVAETNTITKEIPTIEDNEKQAPCIITPNVSNETWSCRSSTEDTEMMDHESGTKDKIETKTISKETAKIETDETPMVSNQTWSCSKSSTQDQKDTDVEGNSSETMICDVTPRCGVTPLDIRIADMPETATEVQSVATGYINIKNNPQATPKSPPVTIKVIRKADSPKFKPQPYKFSSKEENNEISEIGILRETIHPLVATEMLSVMGHSTYPDDNTQQTPAGHPHSDSVKIDHSSNGSSSNSRGSSSSSSSSSDSEVESISSNQEPTLKDTTAVGEKKDAKTPKESVQELVDIDMERRNNDDEYNRDTAMEEKSEAFKKSSGGDIDSNVKEITNKRKKKGKKQNKKPTIKDLPKSGLYNDEKNGLAENEKKISEDNASDVFQEFKLEQEEKHNSDENSETKSNKHVGEKKKKKDKNKIDKNKNKEAGEKDTDKTEDVTISDDNMEHGNSEQMKNTFPLEENNNPTVFAIKGETNSIQSDENTEATHKRMTRISEADTPETDHVMEILIGEEASTFVLNNSE